MNWFTFKEDLDGLGGAAHRWDWRSQDALEACCQSPGRKWWSPELRQWRWEQRYWIQMLNRENFRCCFCWGREEGNEDTSQIFWLRSWMDGLKCCCLVLSSHKSLRIDFSLILISQFSYNVWNQGSAMHLYLCKVVNHLTLMLSIR